MSGVLSRGGRISLDGGRAVVAAPRVIDVRTVPYLREDLVSASAQSPSGEIIVLMGAVEFCDSSGLGCLIGAVKRARERDARVHLLRVPEKVLDLLRRTGTLGQFQLIESFGDLKPVELPEAPRV